MASECMKRVWIQLAFLCRRHARVHVCSTKFMMVAKQDLDPALLFTGKGRESDIERSGLGEGLGFVAGGWERHVGQLILGSNFTLK